jgi:hypothetical protein
MDTLPTATWIDEPVQLDVTVGSCEPLPPPTFLWESSDPNAVFLPSNTVEDPQVVMDYPSGWFTVTVTVSDDNPLGGTDQASVNIYCAKDKCAATRESGIFAPQDYPADINDDCKHDLADFAIIAADWLLDYAMTEPQPLPLPYIP